MYSAEDVARYIINFCIDSHNPISNLKLQKILYYVQAAFLLEEGKPCFKDEIVKWKHGPVIKEVYDSYVRFIGGVIDEKQDYYDDFVLDNELNLRVISKKFDASIIKENHRKIIIKKDNYEADDLIGTLAKKAKDYNYFAYVVSGDRDLFQLIDDNIHQIYISNKGLEIYDREKVKERYNGLTPEQIIDLKALSGDNSDNIPGILGIGEKTAIALLNQYGNLDGIYENIDGIKGKRQQNLINDKDKAYLSRVLATICTEVDIDLDNLFECDECFSLCTMEAYEYLKSLDIRIYKKDDIKYESKKGLSLPFEIVKDEVGDIHFRGTEKYAGSVTKEGMEIYLYAILLCKNNRGKLKDMLINAKKNLLIEYEDNEEKIMKIEEENKELLKLLFGE